MRDATLKCAATVFAFHEGYIRFVAYTQKTSNLRWRFCYFFGLMMGKMNGIKSIRKSCIIVSQNQKENCAKFVWPFQNTGIPRLVRFQLVRFSIQCGLQTALNSTKFRFSAVFYQKISKKIFFFKFGSKKTISDTSNCQKLH